MAVQLSEAALEARRQYMREWRARNKARTAEITARYWERKAKAQLEQKDDIPATDNNDDPESDDTTTGRIAQIHRKAE